MKRCYVGRGCIKYLMFIGLQCYLLACFTFLRTLDLTSADINDYIKHEIRNVSKTPASNMINTTLPISPLEAWQKQRQALLATDGPRKLYLLSYMRGGSTLFGETFNQDPSAWYWYEPLNLFYGAYFAMPQPRHPYSTLLYNETHYREMSPWEQSLIAQHVHRQLSCQLHDLPVESLASDMLLKSSQHLKAYTTCLTKEKSNAALKGTKASWKMVCGDTTGLASKYCSVNALKAVASLSGLHKKVSGAVASDLLQCPLFFEVFEKANVNNSKEYKNNTALTKMLQHRGLNITASMLTKHTYLGDKVAKFQELFDCRMAMRKVVDLCLQKTNVQKQCEGKTLRVTKNLRLKMAHISPTIYKSPDIFIVHYVRDPRAIAYSQMSLDKCKPIDTCFTTAAIRLCSEMAADLAARNKLEVDFPGVFLLASYEDLVTNSTKVMHNIYNLIGRSLPTQVSRWLAETTHAKKPGGAFSVKRSNGAKHVDAWRKMISSAALQAVNNHSACKGVLQELGYS